MRLVVKAFNFVGHILKIIAADGSKRIKYALIHILFIGIAVFSMWLTKYLFIGTFEEGSIHLVAGILGIIVAIAFVIPFTLHGFIGQAVTVFMCLIGSIRKEERIYNILGFILAIASIVGAGFAIYYLIIR